MASRSMKGVLLFKAVIAFIGMMVGTVPLGAQGSSLWSVQETLGGLTPPEWVQLEELTGGPLNGLVNLFRGLPGPDYLDLFNKPLPKFQLQLPGGFTLTSEFIGKGPFGETIIRFKGGYGVFTTNSKGLYGNLVVGDHFYAVSSFMGQRVSVVEVLYRDTVDHVTAAGDYGDAAPATNPKCAADSDISILFLASSAVASELADVTAEARIALEAIAETLKNSGITGRVTLAGVGIIPFTTTASMADDLKALTTSKDALSHRAKTGADIVFLITDHKKGGHAAKVLADIDSAFAVVSANNINNPRYTVAHEFGHLLGAGHDSGSAHPDFRYGAAYNSTAGWCTMMSVEAACSTRQKLFSTPHQTWRHETPGGAGLYNAGVVQTNFSAVARFNCKP